MEVQTQKSTPPLRDLEGRPTAAGQEHGHARGHRPGAERQPWVAAGEDARQVSCRGSKEGRDQVCTPPVTAALGQRIPVVTARSGRPSSLAPSPGPEPQTFTVSCPGAWEVHSQGSSEVRSRRGLSSAFTGGQRAPVLWWQRRPSCAIRGPLCVLF